MLSERERNKLYVSIVLIDSGFCLVAGHDTEHSCISYKKLHASWSVHTRQQFENASAQSKSLVV